MDFQQCKFARCEFLCCPNWTHCHAVRTHLDPVENKACLQPDKTVFSIMRKTCSMNTHLLQGAVSWAALKGDPCRCKFPEPKIRTVQIYSVGNPLRSMKIHQDPSKSIRIHQNPSRSIRIFQIEGRTPAALPKGRRLLAAAPWVLNLIDSDGSWWMFMDSDRFWWILIDLNGF